MLDVDHSNKLTQESLACTRVSNSCEEDSVRVHSGKESGKRNGSNRAIHGDDGRLNKLALSAENRIECKKKERLASSY